MSWNQTQFTKAIIHVDGDAFFASCEEALHPEYRGKPVIVGKDRGIAASMNYIAKSRGVTRAMPLHKIKKLCPDAIIVPSDYETYSLFSKRMFAIMRRYSNTVEEYGIDEGFVDLTGMRKVHGMGYRAMAARIKQEIQRELDITVSLGLAPTKVLAKLGSKYCKPDGFVALSGKRIEDILRETDVSEIWGIGPNTAQYMYKLGITTAYQFVQKDWSYVEQYFTKPHQEIYQELRSVSVYPVITEQKNTYASISKTRTFSPASDEKEFVYSQLIKNVENACIKARRYHLAAKKVSIFIKKQNFGVEAVEVCINRATAFPQDIIPVIKPLFDQLYKENTKYRATGVVLAGLKEDVAIQGSLFEAPVQLSNMKQIYAAVDVLAGKFGKHTVHAGASLTAQKQQHDGACLPAGRTAAERTFRRKSLLTRETVRKRLRIPMLSVKLA